MDKNKGIIGERLYYLRKKNKFEVNYITNKLDIARSTLNGYEAGTRSPNAEMLVKLSELYNTTVDFIIGKTEIESPNESETLKHFMNTKEFVYNGKKLSEEDTETIRRLAELIDKTILDKYKEK